MTTLLEKAKNVALKRRSGRECSDEEIELALAWLKDEIALKQISMVIGQKHNNMLAIIPGILRQAYRQGKLVIKE